MSDQTKILQDVLAFLMAEWQRQDTRQLISVDLVYTPLNGFRDEEIRKWVRADEPELFADFVNIERLAQQIVEIAEGEANAKPPGKHRFVVRCVQHSGSRPLHSFALSPQYHGGDDMSLMPAGGGGGGRDQQVIANHAGQLMRINAQMFEGTIRVLGQQNMNLHQQVTDLTAENAMLRKELEEARSNKMDREFQLAMAAEKNARTNAGFQKLLQFGTVAIAKMSGGGEEGQGGGSSSLAMLIAEFYQSLRNDQVQVFMQTLDMAQKVMFMEIVNLVRPPEQKDDGKPPSKPAGAASGAPFP